MDDAALLHEYARTGSEAAFSALVQRHVGLVYAAAQRQVRDPQYAEDITQAVFMVLAAKARHVARHTGVSGWLLQTTRYAANAHIRAMARRARREQEAAMQYETNDSSPAIWTQLKPYLDEAMAALGMADRTILALRYFENKTALETAALLGIKEGAAHKRTLRALERLRKLFVKRGVALTAGTIASAISAHAVPPAPGNLIQAVSVAAANKGAAAGSTKILVKGVMKIMGWSKVKTAVIVGIYAAIILTTTTVTLRSLAQNHTTPTNHPVLPTALIESLAKSPAALQSKDAVNFLRELRVSGQLPGFQSNEPAVVRFPIEHLDAATYPMVREFTARKADDVNGPFPYHFLLVKESPTNSWQLQKSWIVDTNGASQSLDSPAATQ